MERHKNEFPSKGPWTPLCGELKEGEKPSPCEKPALKAAGLPPSEAPEPFLRISLGSGPEEFRPVTGICNGAKLIRVRALSRPHSTSYFFPGKVKRRPVQFLINTGYTTNLLSKQVFDKLSSATRSLLEESDSHGLMADGTRLTFYGVVRLPVQIRDI